MRNSPISLLCLGLCFLVITQANAQQNTLITGSIKNSQTKENLAAVSVVIKGSTSGTYTDEKGNFRLVTDKTPPFTIVISSIGYTEKEITVESANQNIDTELEPSYALGQDIVIAASRLPQRILEAPVTIDRINANAIRNAPGPNYYDALGNLKGVDVVNSSYTFKTISTHGFNGSGNLRFNQLVDGMDNSAPALNFSVGNVIGLTDLDVDNMELLSGASSALYGSGGMNGTLLITSKDPFKYQGFSIEVKEGIMHINDYRHKASPLHDIAFRWGKKVSDKFAFKIGAEYIKADDWRADDSTDLLRNNVYSKIKPGTRATDENYDGVNIYGDEVSAFIPQLGFAFSRTGYYEKDLVDYNTYDLKISGGAYYKISPNTEVSLTGNWGAGTTVYTGADRYSLKNLSLGQYKLEFKNPNWFLRGYTTQENSGDSYAATLTAISIDEAWKDDPTWFGTYAYVFGTAVGNNIPVDQAYIMARAAADDGRLLPGTKGFETAFKKVISTPISEGGVAKNGSKFVDKSSLYHFEGQYNFSQFVKAVDILVGADYRWYNLNSHNTIFYEPDGPLKISEYGVYAQLQKSLLDDVLKLSVSGRYDKGENFNGRFTPRATATIKVAKDNNIRLSYQQAYRYPNNQDQYINLFTPGSILVGCLPVFNTLYHFDTNPVYTAESVGAYRSGLIDSTQLVVANFAKGKPETMSSYEIGYRGVINTKLFIDAYYYFSTYKNFIGRQAAARSDNKLDLLDPSKSMNFSFVVNSSKNVNANGWGIGADYQIGKGYMITANVFSDQLTNVDSTFITFFNTPKTRFNIGLSNSNLGKGFGFNIIYRWQDKTYWESTFGTGEIPSYGTLDAQVSYHFTKQKVLIKLGGTNITNHYYRNAFGNPYIGGLYYVSMGFDLF